MTLSEAQFEKTLKDICGDKLSEEAESILNKEKELNAELKRLSIEFAASLKGKRYIDAKKVLAMTERIIERELII